MIRHYYSQAIKQAYVVIFGLDVIGNPFGLVVGVSRSVEDLFYEPFQVSNQTTSNNVKTLIRHGCQDKSPAMHRHLEAIY